MKLIEIEGVEIPTPSDYRVSVFDITKSERNARGTMIMEKITTKRKIELSWNYLSEDDLKEMLNIIEQLFFNVEYIDPQDGIKSGTFYKGDRKVRAMDYWNGNIRWKDIKFNLVER